MQGFVELLSHANVTALTALEARMMATVQERAKEAIDFAKDQAKTAASWMELSNALFGLGGKCAQLFPTRSDRAQFAQTAEYKEIAALMGQLPGANRLVR